MFTYIWIVFLLFFTFPLSDHHISVKALLYVSLGYFLFHYCVCVNQLYRKKKKEKAWRALSSNSVMNLWYQPVIQFIL